eukprot:g25995.t1
MLGANVIVVCDVLNALGAGFSLKFIDLFLKVDYGVSPAGEKFDWHAWSLCESARLKQEGYRAKLGVAFLWSLALLFLGLICVPGMPLWIVIPSIVLMQKGTVYRGGHLRDLAQAKVQLEQPEEPLARSPTNYDCVENIKGFDGDQETLDVGM